jgi:hypothetical protein
MISFRSAVFSSERLWLALLSLKNSKKELLTSYIPETTELLDERNTLF